MRTGGRLALRIAAVATVASLGSLQPVASAQQTFPYVPTQILAPGPCSNESACDGRDAAYVFTPDGEFLSFDYSSNKGTPALKTVTSKLPFVNGANGTTSFSAARTGNGTVMVYAGTCNGNGSLWTYSQSDKAGWAETTLQVQGQGETATGPYFLGGSLAFSSTLAPVMDEPTFYTYGGICATPSADDASTWQSSGNYTTDMMSLRPDGGDKQSYTLGLASTSGPATPIAGFTLTALAPSVSNISGQVTQQASYVVLGGNTRQAFINISTAAVWNLPEQSWTYVSILEPESDGRSELAVKNAKRAAATAVESRSGHTAVLSEDGESIAVLGGWVGDVTNAATPQLAILKMSQAYSGWRWTVPESQPTGNGMYGHGAALLPGNVMMVYGGWSIGGNAQKMKGKMAKRADPGAPQFLNLTSMTWSSSYRNANTGSDSGSEPEAPGSTNSSPSISKLGLGLGLGLGLAVLIAAILAVLFWRHRAKKRAAHEEAVRALAQDAAHFINAHDDEMMERDDLLPWALSGGGWYTGGQDAYENGERSLGYETMRRGGSSQGGPFIPAPAIYRKPVPSRSRSGYMPAGSRPNNFMAVPGRIHPILEDDEEEEDHLHEEEQHNVFNEPHTPTSEAPSDPFLTPTTGGGPGGHAMLHLPPPGRGSSTPSPEGIRRHDPEVQDWVSDVDAAEGMLTRLNTRHGRMSPSRRPSHRSGAAAFDDDARTASNLSESNRSAADSLARSGTGRRTAVGALFAGSTLLGSNIEHQKPGSSSSSSYNTAKSSFGALQAEGPSLLMGHNGPGSPGYDDDNDMYPALPGSPSKSKPRRGWLGSLRRVFSNSGATSPSLTATTSSSRDESPHRVSADYEPPPPLVALRGELLRRKQGRQDWDAGGGDALSLKHHGADAEGDWDIERAVEQRLVQVMFTVPKERLRVVNVDEDEMHEEEASMAPQVAELVDGSGGSSVQSSSSLSRKGSRRSPKRDLEKMGLGLVLPPPTTDIHIGDDEDHNQDPPSRTASPESMDLQSAEAARMERRRTRVQQMVDSIESKSREGSPQR